MSGMSDSPDRQVSRPAVEKNEELPDKAVFERVLRETLGQADSTEQAEAIPMDVLLHFARRHQSEPLRLEPVARQLVGLLLKIQFPKLNASQDFWDQVSSEIATTLMEDPQQKALLHRFWNNLCDRAA